MLSSRLPYQELGPSYLDSRDREQTKRMLVRRLNQLGVNVIVSDAAA